MNENALLKSFETLFHQSADVQTGPGDDCAVISRGNTTLLAAADQLIGQIHYYLDTPPRLAAAKLLKRNLSDIAAMGGVPRWALCTLACKDCSAKWMQEFFAGLEECAKQFNVSIIGGDLAELPAAGQVSTLTILGEAPSDEICLRSNAVPGEIVCVTGVLGDSLKSEHHLHFTPRLAEGRFLAQNHFTRCMMDLSDGLAADLPRLLEKSACGAIIDLDTLPRRNGCPLENALADGEDYELLFTVKESVLEQLQKQWQFAEAFTPIGRITSERGSLKYCSNGQEKDFKGVKGYEHFTV